MDLAVELGPDEELVKITSKRKSNAIQYKPPMVRLMQFMQLDAMQLDKPRVKDYRILNKLKERTRRQRQLKARNLLGF